ncbi:Signal peptidase I (SPase I) (Leader peptidase I) [Ectocarpus siliculosus]|uniref:Signal peptidase I (SPase I) (Leader peptidase I) n=1 Tax=Ectocarpus siliculosus TaxID=2880 RepID=D8LKT2_ECTSI|nr:Signal peptidase I (SPase I) (Leader peptidase I) [Ectocarpus siliculosus]|eukprot:CBN80065.1 Signal peptidase I (SPase I) (Leader peptidase I) [Ectocarpus siliculosus]
MYGACAKLVPAALMVLAHMHFARALISPRPTASLSWDQPVLRGRPSVWSEDGYGSSSWKHQRMRRGRRCGNFHQRQRTRAPALAMLFEKRPEERALGDVLIPEDSSGGAGGGSGDDAIGVSVEPPGFLKRVFSVPKNVRRTAAAGDVVVPVIGARDGWGGIRQRLADQGIYPGVEYRILERGDWPVRVPAREFPVMLTPFSYNAATAWAAFTTSLSLLSVGFVLSQALTLSVINSHSMEPTLQVGDVVLVEKVSRSFLVKPNDIVYFRPPPVLQDIVSRAGGSLSPSDLFVKRVAALSGDTVTVGADGRVDVRAAAGGGGGNTRLPKGTNRADNGGGAAGGDSDSILGDGVAGQEGSAAAVAAAKGGALAEEKVALPDSVLQRIARLDEKVLPSGSVFVLGDNPAASMDSRVWGQLDKGEIVGHALLRVFPPRSFGLLQ